jgi:hypothetical protein
LTYFSEFPVVLNVALKYRNHPCMVQNASYRDGLKVTNLKNVIADKQNISGLCQQWTNETNPKISFLGGFPSRII